MQIWEQINAQSSVLSARLVSGRDAHSLPMRRPTPIEVWRSDASPETQVTQLLPVRHLRSGAGESSAGTGCRAGYFSSGRALQISTGPNLKLRDLLRTGLVVNSWIGDPGRMCTRNESSPGPQRSSWRRARVTGQPRDTVVGMGYHDLVVGVGAARTVCGAVCVATAFSSRRRRRGGAPNRGVRFLPEEYIEICARPRHPDHKPIEGLAR